MIHRLHQCILIASTIVGSWLLMQAVHESGHALAGKLTGGRVTRVVLHPLTISRTDLDYNPHPLLVVWAGPIVGVLLPMAAWALAAWLRMPGAFVLRFLAGFCLIANGAYIGVGSFEGIGDSGEMLRQGSSMWLLWLFGAATMPAGLWLWHRQGMHFGLGTAAGRVSWGVAYATLAGCVVLVMLEFAVGVR
jgi:hypothetical protein